MGDVSKNMGKFIVLFIVFFLVLQVIVAKINPRLSIFEGFLVASGLVLGFVLIIVIGIIVVLNKGEAKNRWRSDAADYLGNSLREMLRKIPWIGRMFQMRNAGPEGELPFEFRNLRLELQILMDYMLRLGVYNEKADFVAKVQEQTEKMDLRYKDIREPGKQKADCWEYKVGIRYVQDPKTTEWKGESFEIGTTDKDGPVADRRINTDGWGNHRGIIFRIMNDFRKTLMNTDELMNTKIEDKKEYLMNILNRSVSSLIGSYNAFLDNEDKGRKDEDKKAKLNVNWNKFKAGIEFYGLTQKRDSHRWAVLDQNNINGKYRHTFRFARLASKKGPTKSEIWKVKVVENRLGKRFIVPEKAGKREIKSEPEGDYGLGTQLFEVDERGFFVDDINKILVEKYPKNPNRFNTCRKIPIGGIIDHGSFADICSDICVEWAFFIKDVQTGIYHPFSRTAADYNLCHEKRDHYYRNLMKEIKKSRKSPGAQYPAFDREALKNPNFVYRGKKIYTDKTENLMENDPIRNPALSTRGMTEYIHGRIKEIEKLSTLEEEKYMRAWKFDYSKEGEKEEKK
ncbi:hypothetical protein KY366_04770 [Candidatus Woesearchaeota archaeon]|nr:hypothetical protein [Candidatus Woesearchaeota archaeon]